MLNSAGTLGVCGQRESREALLLMAHVAEVGGGSGVSKKKFEAFAQTLASDLLFRVLMSPGRSHPGGS